MIPQMIAGLLQCRSPRGAGSKPAQFDRIMDMAHRISDKRRESLLSLIHGLARPLISTRLIAPTMYDERTAPGHFPDDNGLFKQLWFDPLSPLTADRRNSFDLRVCVRTQSRISFAAEPVVSMTWKTEAFERALVKHGAESDEAWRADRNHLVHLWLPFRIAVVAGGNHSIAAGILTGRGEVMSRDTFCFDALFDHVACDGRQFIRVHDGHVLAPVAYPEWAAIFEIGRLLAAK